MTPARRTTATALVLATAGGVLTATAAPAAAAVSCTSPVFKREFFANTTFSGTPKKTDCDSAIDQNWGTGAPIAGVPSNNFGVRWSVTRDFGSGGPFTFSASAQDGVRVHLDGVRKIDLWKNVSTTAKQTVNVTVPSGKHTLRVDFVNWTGTANVKFAYTPRTSATVDKVKPLTPTGSVVTYDATTGAAKLTWSKNKEMDLAGYRVYRRLKGQAYPTAPLATTTATTYTDTPPATGETYYYEVRAADKAGNVSAGTADQPVTTPDRTAPAAPTGLYAKVVPGSVSLGWDTADALHTYRVYRATAPDGPFTRIADALDSAWYRDTSADLTQRLYYRVTALDPAGNESAPATRDTGAPDTTPPAQVTGVTVEGTTAGNAVRWQAPSADVHHYEVWTAPEGGSDPDGPRTVYGLSYHDALADTGAALTYRVQAVDWFGNLGPVSDPVTATRPAPGTASAPTGVTGTPRDGGTELTWGPVNAGYPSGYRVYRRTTDTAAWTRLGDRPTTAYRYEDTEAADGITDYYVVALDAQGRESAPSEVVRVLRETPATPTAPEPPTITLSAPYTECTANDCVAHGGTGVTLTVTLEHERLLSGYLYRFVGPVDSGWFGTDQSPITWKPPARGLYTLEVAAVDVYGRTGPFTSVSFKVA
ncbi:fibronectin type III domain-containing protein [Streptomyces sp. NPDC001595]|uniref:fibronectin type III domain-containing protein n=1 Tax=Streptomyces sp. NPDC001532 TaxID=3154520 RepID=UPI00331D2D79